MLHQASAPVYLGTYPKWNLVEDTAGFPEKKSHRGWTEPTPSPPLPHAHTAAACSPSLSLSYQLKTRVERETKHGHTAARAETERESERGEGDQEAFVWLRDHKLHHGPITQHLLPFFILSALTRWTRNHRSPLWHLPGSIPPPPPPPRLRCPHKYRIPLPLPLPPLLLPGTRILCPREKKGGVESCLGRSGGRDDEGVVDGGAAAAAGALLPGPGGRLVPAGPAGRWRRRRRRGLVAGGEQAVRGGAGAGRRGRAGPVGAGGVAAAREDGARCRGALPRPGERRVLHRGRPRALPPLQRRRLPGLRVHPGLGRRRRRRRPGLQALLLLHGQRQARARLGPGAQEGRALDRGGAQTVPDGSEEVRARGLEEHLAQLRHDPDAHAGGQPRAEVLHPPQLRRQGQATLQHPRHHHRQHPRRRPQQQPLAVAALRAHRKLHPLGAVRRARRQQAASTPRRPLHAPSLRQREARGQQRRLSRRPPRRLCSDADAMRPAPASRLTKALDLKQPLRIFGLGVPCTWRDEHPALLVRIASGFGSIQRERKWSPHQTCTSTRRQQWS